jgi:hypothetical protein
MPSAVRRFRGLGVALAVLALSAGAVFASTPGTQLTPRAIDAAENQSSNADPSESESAEPTESPEPTETTEPSESPEPSGSPEAPGGAPGASPNADTHGALVSTAAQMPTPSGFPNHGAFVSCVAHLDASLTGFDWTTVTPASCGITPASTTAPSNHASPNGAAHGAAGKAHGAAARGHHPGGH